MSGDVQKIPLVIGLNRFTEDKNDDAIQMLGKAVPASIVSVDETGTIVTIKFEIESDLFTLPQVECALATDQYTRPPIAKGDKGYVVPSDYYMGGVTALGGGTANFEKQPNLSALVFHPCGNADYDALYDKDRYVIFGPKGVVIQNKDGTVLVTVGPTTVDTNSIMTIKGPGGKKVTIGPTVDGPNNIVKIETLIPAANDSAAAAAGVPINGLYQTSGAVKVRIS